MRNSTFEEATRCPDCNSDQIYVLQDDGSGMCWKCKALISGPIVGGFGYLEARRLRGLVPDEKSLNDRDKEEAAHEEVRKSVNEALRIARPDTVKPATGGAGAPPVAPPGPSLGSRVKGFFGAVKEKLTPKPKPATPTQARLKAPPSEPFAPRPEPPKAVPAGMPQMGQQWSVGPCTTCRLSEKIVGTVVKTKATGTSTRFVEIHSPKKGSGYYGCFFCAKEA